MNATKRITTLSLGLGLLMASGSAFAHGQRGTPGLLDYDTNSDHRISMVEFQERELLRCANDFRQNDLDQNGVVTDREWNRSRAIHCEAWRSAYNWDNANDVSYHRIPRPYYRTRWDLTVYDRPRIIHRQDSGLTWNELRQVSLEQSRRSFFTCDNNRDGSLNKGELREFVDGDQDDYQPAPRPYLPLAYYRSR